MGTPSISKRSGLFIDSNGATFSGSSPAYEFISETLTERGMRSEDEGIRGTRARFDSRVTQSSQEVGGSIVFEPTPIELDTLLVPILGTTESSDYFAVAETLPARDILVSKLASAYKFSYCLCDSASFESSEKSKLRVTTNWLGKSRSAVAIGSFPTPAYDNVGDVYMHHQLTVDLGGSVDASGVYTTGTTYDCLSCRVDIQNFVQQYFRNSKTATALVAADRAVLLSMVLPFTSDELALYPALQDGASIAGQVTWTSGNKSLKFIFPSLKAMPETPVVPGGTGEITLPLNLRAYETKISTTIVKEVYTWNDSTP